jgi:hypothetical protein
MAVTNPSTTSTYNVHYTDLNVQPIVIQESDQDNSTDISLFGRIQLEYGQALDQDLLQIFENFACPEAAGSTIGNSHPDYTVNGDDLTKPSAGQIWYNSTRQLLYYWNAVSNIWVPLGGRGQYAANWGQIGDGNQIPAPINPYTNEPYSYSQCIWAVSPANVPSAYTYMICTTDQNANVRMQYRAYGDIGMSSGTANFLIINITGNINQGSVTDVTPATPAISATPTATPTPSPAISPTTTPTPTATHTATHTPVVSPTRTPAASATPSPTPQPSPTRTPAPSNTPAPSVTPTPSPFANTCEQCTADHFDCCVSIGSYLPDGRTAGDVKVGDYMHLADEVSLEPFFDKVSYSEPSLQDSVLIITEKGVELECSKTAPIPTKKGIILSPNVEGEFVAVNIRGKASWDKVVAVKELGEIWVQHITVNNKSFWAGKQDGMFILHHNIKCCYCGGISNCQWVAPNCCLCV